jgi:hypothetical protein
VLSDRTAAIIEGAYDDKGRLRVSRLAGPVPDVSIIIPRKTVFATALWIVETSERPGERFAARQEEWMSVPATPQELAEFIAAIPTDAIARELPSLSKLEQDTREACRASVRYLIPKIFLAEPILSPANLHL